LAEFLVQAYDGALDGTLLLQTPEREKSAVLFVRGAPAKARLARNEIFLGDVAVDLGLIPRSVCVSTRKRAKAEEKTHGAVLKEEGHLDETGLYLALREQLFRQILWLSDLPDTTGFGFYEANYLANWGPSGEWRVKPLPMIWRALADHLPKKRRDAWLARLGDTPLRMRPEAPVSRYALTAKEKGVLDMLRAMPSSFQKLSESGVGNPEEVGRVACALLLSRQIEVGSSKDPVGLHEAPESPNSLPPPETRAARRSITAPRHPSIPSGLGAPEPSAPMASTPGASAAGASAPPARPSRTSTASRSFSKAPGATDAFRAEVEAYETTPPQNHYEQLGVDKKADSSTIRSAFFALARRWHPDRLPAELEDIRATVTKAFAAMGEAHGTLSDDAQRAEYDRKLEETPDDEQAQVAAILNAASAFQRAEVLMKKKNFTEALEQAKEAYEGDPTQADHAALYAWLQGTQRSSKFEELISMLDAALEGNSDNVRALWYRGQLLKKAGQHLRAIKDFKQVVRLKPNHMEAKRELHIHTMRKRSDPKAGKKSGLFGFGKKE